MRSRPLTARTQRRLRQRWPPLDLVELFLAFLAVYRNLLACDGSAKPERLSAYRTLCGWIATSAGWRQVGEAAGNSDVEVVDALVAQLREKGGADWLQWLASVLAMLMHFRSGKDSPGRLHNRRRPHKPFSTYPTSPGVASFAGHASLSTLLRGPVPTTCRNRAMAERYAERALDFRVVDPSMESGQLLLGMATAAIDRIHELHAPDSAAAGRLVPAVLERLCNHCLWGLDQSELAAEAVRLMFLLLGREMGIANLSAPHLRAVDSLSALGHGELSRFDGLINNPPWGETMTSADWRRFRGRLETIRHRPDTYVAFAELGLESLKPGGSFLLILPSQFVASRNAAGLRELLADRTELDRLVLLSREAFADATVRGAVLAGHARPASPKLRLDVTILPIVRPLNGAGPIRRNRVAHQRLKTLGHRSWAPALNGASNGRPRPGVSCELERVARVVIGVQLYGKGRGEPPQTAAVVRQRPFTSDLPAPGSVPAVRGRDLKAFDIGPPRQFVQLGKWLKWVGDHEKLRGSQRIFLRELCHRDGWLTAAIARNGFVPLHGVLTLVPLDIDAYVLTAILNSGRAAEYVREHTASFSKVDFQRITVGELRRMPIPLAALHSRQRVKLGLRSARAGELALRGRLRRLSKKLSEAPQGDAALRERIQPRLDTLVTSMFEQSEI